MMKLTVALLGALAVADAATPRGHRHVRRQYGYGNGPTNSTATTQPPVGTTDVSPELPSSSSSSSSSSVTVPGVTFPGSGTAPGTAPATDVNTDKPTTLPGMTYPGTGTAPVATDVATPLPETTSLSPVGGNTTSSFPTFVLTGTEGSFPTGVPSGIYPTGTGAEDLVTLTISSTQIFTVTACPSSVTDCPARSTSLVTSVVAVGTTVCPESEASSIVESGLPSSATATKTSVEAVGTPVPTEVVEDKTSVLTQTIGTGTNAHETKITITNKVTKTIYVTTGDASVPVTTSVSPEQTGGADEPTTYVTSDVTSTVAKTLTITEGAPSGTGSPSGVPVNPEGTPVNPSGGAGECAPPVTVTVTAQETVTVTASGSTETGTDTPANPGEVPSEDTTTISPEKPTHTGVPQHPTGAPYPTLNGTAPHVPGSSGFLTATKPSGAIPTGGAPGYGAPAPSGSGAVPSGGDAPTATLPSFVLPSATPAGEAPTAPGETTTSVSPDAPPPAETSAYGGGYGYGSKKRAFFGLF